MKKIFFIICLLGPSVCFAGQLNLYCREDSSTAECAERSEDFLEELGCEVNQEKTTCSAYVDDSFTCTIYSNKCNYAREQLFVPWSTCGDDEKYRIPLNSGLSDINGYRQVVCISE